MKIKIEADNTHSIVIDLNNPNITLEWKKYYNDFIQTVMNATLEELENANDEDIFIKAEIKRD